MLDKTFLLDYAKLKGRPHFCETIMQRFLILVAAEATTTLDVDNIYLEFRHGKEAKNRRARVIAPK